MKRTIAAMLLFVFVLSISVMGANVPPDSPDASYYISSYSAKVINGGNGNLKVSFDVTGTSTMTRLGASAISIYRSTGSYVTSIYYFSAGRSAMMGSNTIYHSDVETIHVGAGSYYAVVTFFAQNSSGSDTKTYQTGVRVIT